jgi:hypothetical protein
MCRKDFEFGFDDSGGKGILSIDVTRHELTIQEKVLFGKEFPDERCNYYELRIFLLPKGLITKNLYVLYKTPMDPDILEVLLLNLIPDFDDFDPTIDSIRQYGSSLGEYMMIPVQHEINDHTSFIIKRVTRENDPGGS